MAPFDDRARTQQFNQRCDNRLAHSIGARRQQLHDGNVGESIDNHARQPVAVAVDEPVRIGVAADKPSAQFDRAFEAPRDQLLDCRRLAPCNHPDRDRRRRIAVAHAEQRV